MCGVSLKDRRHSVVTVVLYSLVGVLSVANVVYRSRSRWFGHLEQYSSMDD